MTRRARKFGILLSSGPETPGFRQGLSVAGAELGSGSEVYLYCVDEAVRGVADPRLQELRANGLRLFACALGARRYGVKMDESAIFSGLATLSGIIANADRFENFG